MSLYLYIIMSGNIKLHDGYELITKKIIIHRASQECLKKQIAFSQAIIALHENSVRTATEKLKLVDQTVPILEAQLTEFDELRQADYTDLISYINEIDNDPAFPQLAENCSRTEDEFLNLANKINEMEKTIPAQQVITNYTIKPNVEDTGCATEYVPAPDCELD